MKCSFHLFALTLHARFIWYRNTTHVRHAVGGSAHHMYIHYLSTRVSVEKKCQYNFDFIKSTRGSHIVDATIYECLHIRSDIKKTMCHVYLVIIAECNSYTRE